MCPRPQRPRSSLTRALGLSLATTLAVTLSSACGSRLRDVRGVDSIITKVELVGVERFSKKEFLEHLELGQSSKLPWKPKEPYIEALLPIDLERIVELYQAYGYYDAEVLAITGDTRPGRIRKVGRRKGERRLGKTRIEIVVREGEPTPIRDLAIRWPEGHPQGPSQGPEDPKAAPAKIEAAVGLKAGDPFEVPALTQGSFNLREALRSRGYAFATVEEAAEVDPGTLASIDYAIAPGPHVTIGEVIIEGLERVPERYVRTEIDFASGSRASPQVLKRVEDGIYGMGVFQSVTVALLPRTSRPADGGKKDNDEEKDNDKKKEPVVVDVRVRVVEAPTQSLKVGPGIGIDPVRWEQRAQLIYRHRNLGHNLTRFELRTLVGYAQLPALYRPETHGPLVQIDPTFTQKGFLEPKTSWTLAPRFELGIWEGYQFYSPELRMGPSRFFTRYFQLALTYNLRFVDFFNIDPAFASSASILGRDFRDPYLLSYVQPRATVYLVDNMLAPRQGAIIEATYDIAGLGGDFSFHRIRPVLRAYYSPHRRLTLAVRGSLGFIFPFGPRAGAPIDMKFYLGGADTVRGWGIRRLSPKVLDSATCPTFSAECPGIPVGGQTMFFSNAEVRVEVVENVRAVAFFDVGDVRENVRAFDPTMWAMSVGPGLRYASPIGTFRVDVGVRLNQTDRSIGEPRWALHLGLGEAF